MFFKECKNVVKEKKIPQYNTGNRDISSDDSNEENSNENNFNEEN